MTAMSSDPALLVHIAAGVERDIEFLVAQNYLTRADASGILNKLSNISANAGHNTPSQQSRASPFPTAFSAPATPGSVGRRSVPPAPAAPVQVYPKARALWAYNENGEVEDDLSFSVGDIVEIIEEANTDWWMGRVNGKEALFPSTYVEKLPEAASTNGRPVPPARGASAGANGKPAYRPFMAAHAGSSTVAPPPPGGGTNAVGLQEDAGQDQKKSKFGKYGNTMAHSAAGGVGFGAGAAIGGGIVRAIF